MQFLLQLKRSESILQATEAVERWECDVREYEQRFGKTLNEDVKIGVILALAPPQVQNHCHLNSHILKSHAQVRTMLFDYCQAQADTAAGDVVPMDLSMLGEGGKGEKSKGDKKGKGEGKGKKDERRTKAKTRKAKVKPRTMPKLLSTLLDNVFNAKRGDTCGRIAGGMRMPRVEKTLHLWRHQPRQLNTQRLNRRSLGC